jgi:hypothetical protein
MINSLYGAPQQYPPEDIQLHGIKKKDLVLNES